MADRVTAPPERAAALAETIAKALHAAEVLSVAYGKTKTADKMAEASTALDELVAALAAATQRADTAEQDAANVVASRIGPIARRYGWISKAEAESLAAQVKQLREALQEARAYVYNVAMEHKGNWRGETATGVMARVDAALAVPLEPPTLAGGGDEGGTATAREPAAGVTPAASAEEPLPTLSAPGRTPSDGSGCADSAPGGRTTCAMSDFSSRATPEGSLFADGYVPHKPETWARFGDLGVTDDLAAERGYVLRVLPSDLLNPRRKP